MSTDIKILTDQELALLTARRRANQGTLVDPVIVDRLLATTMHYREVMCLAADCLRNNIREVNSNESAGDK